jgi:large repetitive protein
VSTTGGIHGSVLQADGAGGHAPVVGATVYVLPPGETDPAAAVTSTGTSQSGGFTVLGLEPGTYDLLAMKNGEQGSVVGVSVGVGISTLTDVVLSGSGGGGSAAEVHGIVRRDDGTGNLVPVDGATVYALLPGETDPGQAIGSSTTGADGRYSIGGLVPGTYDLLAVEGPLMDFVFGVELLAGSFLDLDITIL